jgi:hypothetical protein
MKIRFNTQDLIDALGVVSIVPPRPVTAGGGAGYLFVVKDLECLLYSRDDRCVSRAKFELIEKDEDGSFIYPSEYIGALQYLVEDGTCTITATLEEGNYRVRYDTPGGAEFECGSFDPTLMATCDDDIKATKVSHEFRAGILREAISLARPFLAEQKDNSKAENFKGLEVIDGKRLEKGDGYLYAADGNRAYYFYSEVFKGKSLEIHGAHLPSLISFLGKCDDLVTINKGSHYTFAMNDKGHVFGWPEHNKLHDKFNYYAAKKDSVVLSVNKARLFNSLMNARGCMKKSDDKIKINFSPERKELWFAIAESKAKTIPVSVKYKSNVPVENEVVEVVEPKSFSIGANIDSLIELVESIKGHDVEFRGVIQPPSGNRKNEVGLFRTVDEFLLDLATGKVTPEMERSAQCRVTRFMPSKD